MSRSSSGESLSPTDKNTMRIAITESRIAELEGRMTRQEQSFQDFIPSVAKCIGTTILAPWLTYNIKLPDSLNDNRMDPLSLRDFDIKGALDRINQRGKV